MTSVMLYQFAGPHSSHRNFGDSVDCDYWHFERGVESDPPVRNEDSIFGRVKTGVRAGREFNHLIGEGTTTVQSLLPAGTVSPSTRLSLLIADETFLHVSNNVWSVLGPISDRMIDDVIAVSPLCAEWAGNYIDSEIDIVRPSVHGKIANSLKELPISQNSSVRTVICAGSVKTDNALWKKNINNLVNATRRADLDLTLLGEGHPNRQYSDYPHVRCPGWVDKKRLVDAFDNADAYVLPSNGDAYPVSSLEGMIAGLPTIVSEMTGTKELVDNQFVCGTDVDSITATLNRLCDTSRSERVEIGKDLREKASKFTKQRQADKFREVFK